MVHLLPDHTRALGARLSGGEEHSKKGGDMGILAWIIVGMVSGWFVGMLMRSPGSAALENLLLGAMGALLGGILAAGLLGITDSIEGFNLVTILASCAGAVILVAFVKLMNGRRVAATEK